MTSYKRSFKNVKDLTYIELAFHSGRELDTLKACLELIDILDGGTQLIISPSFVQVLCCRFETPHRYDGWSSNISHLLEPLLLYGFTLGVLRHHFLFIRLLIIFLVLLHLSFNLLHVEIAAFRSLLLLDLSVNLSLCLGFSLFLLILCSFTCGLAYVFFRCARLPDHLLSAGFFRTSLLLIQLLDHFLIVHLLRL